MDEEGKSKEENTGAGKDFENLKAEFSRKMDKTTADLASLKQSNQQVIAALEAFAVKSKSTPEKVDDSEDEDLMYSNPAKYKAKLKNEILGEVNKVQDNREATQQAFQKTVSDLVSIFPELNRTDTDMYKKTMEVLNKYPQEQRNDPAVMKAASYQAASEINLIPTSKREPSKDDDDSFSLSAISGNKDRKRKLEKVDEEVKVIASLFGMDIENKETAENLKKHQNRDSWNNWR